MSAVLLLTPLFLIFEIWQLYIGERYLGIKQIARSADPRELGLGEVTAFFWSGGLIVYWLWMLSLLTFSLGRVHGLCLLAVIGIGFGLRRNCRLQWILVILTVEGAIRIGLLVSLCALAWRRL
jgi:hypothetical protein